MDVYFDDFKVEHVKSPVIQSQDYYPFGLSFGSYQRENSLNNQYQYNGKEKQDELDVDWLDYGARMYMPQIGRWNAIDIKSDKYNFASPYNYVLNSPVRSFDPDGQDVIILIALSRGGGYGHVSTLVQDGNGDWYYMVQGAVNPNGSPLKMLFGVRGGMKLYPLYTKDREEALRIASNDKRYGPYEDYIEFHTSKEQDEAIYQEGERIAHRTMNGKKKYHLFFNNCVDAMQDVIEGGTGINMPADFSPKPTKYYMTLQQQQQRVQQMLYDAIKRSVRQEERRERREQRREERRDRREDRRERRES